MFTVNTLGCGRHLERRLCTTDLIESSSSTIGECIDHVECWQSKGMV